MITMSQKLKQKFSVVVFISLYTVAGCAVEVENPDLPLPKKEKSSNVPISGGDIESQPDSTSAPAPSSDSPKNSPEVCQVQISRGETNSSGSAGAVLELWSSHPQNASLKTQETEGRTPENGLGKLFKDGNYASGSITFSFTIPEPERVCIVPVTITPSDIESRLKLTLTIAFPNDAR